MEIHRIIHISRGRTQHFSTGNPNPFEISNIYYENLEEGYYILYSDTKLSKPQMANVISDHIAKTASILVN